MNDAAHRSSRRTVAPAPTSVLFVMSVAERRGGAEKMLWLLLREHDPTRIAPSIVFLQDGPFAGEASALGVPTAVIDAGRMRQTWAAASRAVGRLPASFDRTRPDVIFSWMGKAHLYAGPAAAAGRPQCEHGLVAARHPVVHAHRPCHPGRSGRGSRLLLGDRCADAWRSAPAA